MAESYFASSEPEIPNVRPPNERIVEVMSMMFATPCHARPGDKHTMQMDRVHSRTIASILRIVCKVSLNVGSSLPEHDISVDLFWRKLSSLRKFAFTPSPWTAVTGSHVVDRYTADNLRIIFCNASNLKSHGQKYFAKYIMGSPRPLEGPVCGSWLAYPAPKISTLEGL